MEEDEGRLDTDLADLCDAYSVEKAAEGDETTFVVTVEGVAVRFDLPTDYPAAPPSLVILQQQQHGDNGDGKEAACLIKTFLGGVGEDGRVAVEKVLGQPWSAERTLVEVADALCVATKIARFPGDHLTRDFAYPPHDARHWGTPDDTKPPRRVTALYDFEAQGDNELAFSKNDVMEVIAERNDGWIIAMLNGITGLVPLNHIQATAE